MTDGGLSSPGEGGLKSLPSGSLVSILTMVSCLSMQNNGNATDPHDDLFVWSRLVVRLFNGHLDGGLFHSCIVDIGGIGHVGSIGGEDGRWVAYVARAQQGRFLGMGLEVAGRVTGGTVSAFTRKWSGGSRGRITSRNALFRSRQLASWANQCRARRKT